MHRDIWDTLSRYTSMKVARRAGIYWISHAYISGKSQYVYNNKCEIYIYCDYYTTALSITIDHHRYRHSYRFKIEHIRGIVKYYIVSREIKSGITVKLYENGDIEIKYYECNRPTNIIIERTVRDQWLYNLVESRIDAMVL